MSETKTKFCRISKRVHLKLQSLVEREGFPDMGSAVDKAVAVYEARGRPLTILAMQGTVELWSKSA